MRVGKGIFVLLLLIAPLTGLTGQSSQAVPLAFKDFTIHQLTQNTFLKEGPMTAIDQEGTLLVAWQELGEDNLFHWYDRVYKPLEKEWAPEEAIVSSPSAPTNFRIVGGEGGTFLALWQERDGLVRYSLRSEATGWSLPLDLPFAQGLSAPFHVLYHRYSQAFRLFWTVTDLNGLTLLMGKTLNKSGEWSQESLLYTSTQPLEDYKVSLDSEGHIYVVDASFNNFQIFDEEGQLLLFVGAGGRNPGEFVLPAGMFIDEQDRIYVADQGNSRVQVFQYLHGAVK